MSNTLKLIGVYLVSNINIDICDNVLTITKDLSKTIKARARFDLFDITKKSEKD
jgi:hypothetical protein